MMFGLLLYTLSHIARLVRVFFLQLAPQRNRFSEFRYTTPEPLWTPTRLRA